ncbi:MAG: hypothetical protein O3A53_16235 [Acidobacteria bacterium]|nr:hypothetical protein [Acidobacteriota bacterium]
MVIDAGISHYKIVALKFQSRCPRQTITPISCPPNRQSDRPAQQPSDPSPGA